VVISLFYRIKKGLFPLKWHCLNDNTIRNSNTHASSLHELHIVQVSLCRCFYCFLNGHIILTESFIFKFFRWFLLQYLTDFLSTKVILNSLNHLVTQKLLRESKMIE